MDSPAYLELFASESKEHISAINRHLLKIEAGTGGRAAIEEVFRAVHTVKGMAAAMGFARSAALAHALEHLLEQLRGGALEADQEVTDALFAGVDELESAIDGELAGDSGATDGVIDRLRGIGGAPEGAEPARAERDPAAPPAAAAAAAGPEGPGRVVRVTLMIGASAALPAVRAVLALKRARTLGAIGSIEPDEERLNAGDFSGTLVFLLRTERDADEVRESLLGAGEVAHVLVDEVEESEPGAGSGGAASGGGAVVRVNQERLDQLIDRVGELVIARDVLRRLAEVREDEELESSAEQISRLVAELRDEVMTLRMVPVGEAFDRFPRLVRDAARTLGKRVAFSASGRHIELDRSLLNELGDLLVHLLRNAVDHGIETPEEREAAEKPEAGEIRLSAWRDGSRIAVRVEDDGRGIDRDLVRRSAVRLRLLTEEEAEAFPDAELLSFLARPGFSTADRVTDLSGRGVGLDVVGSRLQALGGTMEVQAEAGEGTAFTLRLPLSLAIVRCLHVEVAGESYLIPLGSILEITEVLSSDVIAGERGDRIAYRDATIPVVWLAPMLDAGGPDPGFGPLPVVVVEAPEGALGLIVGGLVGQHESVLKPFDAAAGMVPLFSGAALLTDGRPSLVVDVNRVATLAADLARQGEPNPEAETLC